MSPGGGLGRNTGCRPVSRSAAMRPEMAILAELLQRTGPLPTARPEYSDVRPAAGFGVIVYDPVRPAIWERGCKIPPIVLPRGASRADLDAAIRRVSPDAIILSHPVGIIPVHSAEPSLRLMRDIYRSAPWVLDQHPDIKATILAFLTLEDL